MFILFLGDPLKCNKQQKINKEIEFEMNEFVIPLVYIYKRKCLQIKYFV